MGISGADADTGWTDGDAVMITTATLTFISKDPGLWREIQQMVPEADLADLHIRIDGKWHVYPVSRVIVHEPQ